MSEIRQNHRISINKPNKLTRDAAVNPTTSSRPSSNRCGWKLAAVKFKANQKFIHVFKL